MPENKAAEKQGEMMRFDNISNKRGLSPIGLLGEILVVLAVIFILLLVVLLPRLQTQGDIAGKQISGIRGDADKDGIRNFFDQCPCTFGDSLYDGCPAAFTEEQIQEDVKSYNSEPVCGIVGGETAGTSASSSQAAASEQAKKTAEQKSEPAAFKNYHSVEIFGNTDDEDDPALDGEIRQACTGWIGKECHSEDDDCDNDEFNYDITIKDGCWIMASEEDPGQNDCGQLKADNGVIISLKEYSDLNADLNQYFSMDKEPDPKNLFNWKWKSTPNYGSLICSNGFWYGCREANEGRDFPNLINGQKYKCSGSEWVKQG